MKEIDRTESEKERLIALKKVIGICIKKGFHFSVNPEVSLITVSTDSYKNILCSYFKGLLVNYRDETTLPIFELLEKLKQTP
jgi:phosphopantetheine adenylyltransferase